MTQPISWWLYGNHSGSSHEHLNCGELQMMLGDQYLLKESSGYAITFADGTTVRQTKYHNCVFYRGTYTTSTGAKILYDGWQANAYQKGPGILLSQTALDDGQGGSCQYIAWDLSNVYHATPGYYISSGPLAGVPRDDCPFAGPNTIRECVFLARGFGVALAIDRLSTNSAFPDAVGIAAFHTPLQPTEDSFGVASVAGSQAVRMQVAVGAAQVNLVDEWAGQPQPPSQHQWRTEFVLPGGGVLVTVLQGRAATDPDVQVEVASNESAWEVGITKPGAGSYVVTILKGQTWTAPPTVVYKPPYTPPVPKAIVSSSRMVDLFFDASTTIPGTSPIKSYAWSINGGPVVFGMRWDQIVYPGTYSYTLTVDDGVTQQTTSGSVTV